MRSMVHKHVNVMDWTIHVAVVGEGPPVLLYHGLGGSWQWWTPTLDGLSTSYSLYAVDLPGAGESSPLKRQPTEKDFAGLTAGLLDSLSIGSAAVVGHSLGGYVALQSALNSKELLKGLALVAPAGVTRIHNRIHRLLAIPIVGDLLQKRLSRSGLKIMLRSLVDNPVVVTNEVVEWAVSSMKIKQNREQFLYQLRLAPHVQSIEQAVAERIDPIGKALPVQIFWGTHDSLFPVRYASRLRDLLGCDAPFIFQRSGHIPQIEEPQLFNDHLQRFLATVYK